MVMNLEYSVAVTQNVVDAQNLPKVLKFLNDSAEYSRQKDQNEQSNRPREQRNDEKSAQALEERKESGSAAGAVKKRSCEQPY